MRESPSPRSAPTPTTAPGHSLPLWQLLIHTAEAVAAVQKGRSLTEALEDGPARIVASNSHGFLVAGRFGQIFRVTPRGQVLRLLKGTQPVSALAIVAGGVLVTLLAGIAFAWRPLAARPAQVLRSAE